MAVVALLGAALAVTAGATAFSTFKQTKAAAEQRKVAKKQRQIDRRVTQLQSQRRSRQAIAARNRERARLVGSAETEGLGQSSGLQGAIGAIRTQTASNLGFANTLISAQNLRANVGLRGFLRTSKLLAQGNLVEGAGSIVSSALTFAAGRKG